MVYLFLSVLTAEEESKGLAFIKRACGELSSLPMLPLATYYLDTGTQLVWTRPFSCIYSHSTQGINLILHILLFQVISICHAKLPLLK